MKVSLLFSTLLIILFATNSGHAQVHQDATHLSNEGKQRYGVESGKIKYEYRGESEGVEIVQFDHWGWRETSEKDVIVTFFGNRSTQKMKTVLDGNFKTTHQKGSQYASFSQDRFINLALQKASKAAEPVYGLESWKVRNAIKKSSDKILGKTCQVYEVKGENLKIWIWKGILLKMEKRLMDKKTTIEATQLDLNFQPEEKAFELPAGLTVNGVSGK